MTGTQQCGAASRALFEGHQPQPVQCTKQVGHGGDHVGLIFDSDDNIITFSWGGQR